jgi:hypothetical protein
MMDHVASVIFNQPLRGYWTECLIFAEIFWDMREVGLIISHRLTFSSGFVIVTRPTKTSQDPQEMHTKGPRNSQVLRGQQYSLGIFQKVGNNFYMLPRWSPRDTRLISQQISAFHSRDMFTYLSLKTEGTLDKEIKHQSSLWVHID